MTSQNLLSALINMDRVSLADFTLQPSKELRLA